MEEVQIIQERWIIEAILGRKTEYHLHGIYKDLLLIKWQSFDQPTWEPFRTIFEDVPEMVLDFLMVQQADLESRNN